jgi:hypothetical protein
MALVLLPILVPFVVIVLALRSRYGLSWWGAFWRGLFVHVVSIVCGFAVTEVVVRFAAEMGHPVSDTILVDTVLAVYIFVAWWLVFRSPLGRGGRATHGPLEVAGADVAAVVVAGKRRGRVMSDAETAADQQRTARPGARRDRSGTTPG